MPQKRLLTKQSAAELTEAIRKARESLHDVRSELIPYFRQDEHLMTKIERLFEYYGEFEKECESEFAKRIS
jgi:hypothetical protein